MDAVQLAAAFDALDRRFRLEAAAGTAQTLYAPTREAGVLLRHGLRHSLLPDPNGFTGLVAQWVAEDRRNRSGPSHRTYQPHDVERQFLDPNARAFALYADRHLAEVVDLPPGGLSCFNTVGLTTGQARVRWVERAHALAACCGAIAAGLRTGEWGPTFTQGWPTATGAVPPTVYSRDFRPLPADTARFDAIRDDIAAHPTEYHEAGAWMQTRYAPYGILAARAEAPYRESSRFPAPEDRRNEPAWRLSCCAMDLREDRRSGALDLSVLGDDQRLIMARRVVYLTWLVTDPDARERGVGVSALEAARWPAREDGVFGRAWVRGVAYLEPELWRALVEEAWRTIERHRRLNPGPPRRTLVEMFAAHTFGCVDMLRDIVRRTSVDQPEPTPEQLREWRETGNPPMLGMSPREDAVYRFRTETRPMLETWLAPALREARERAGGAAGKIAELLQELLEAVDELAEAAVRVRRQSEKLWSDAEGTNSASANAGTHVFDVSYTIDDLNRVTRAQEGHWNGSSISTQARDERWENSGGSPALSHTGNWINHRLNLNGDADFTDTNELDETNTFSDANELTSRDTDSSGSADLTLAYNLRGDQTGTGVYTLVYDAFGRLCRVNLTSGGALVAEYTYNGLGYLISRHDDINASGTVDGSDPVYRYAYDEAWRLVATYRGSDTSPKEQYVCHMAGAGGSGGSSYINAVAVRYKDASTAWTSASDGVLEQERILGANWRGDTVVVFKSDGSGLVEWNHFLAGGKPNNEACSEVNYDGLSTSADNTTYTTLWNSAQLGTYNPVVDMDLDGDADNTDKTLFLSDRATVPATGYDRLSRSDATTLVDNRIGYAGYLWDPVIKVYHVRNRVLDPHAGRWTRRDPLGYVDGMNLYEYARNNGVRFVDPKGTVTVGPSPGFGMTGGRSIPCAPQGGGGETGFGGGPKPCPEAPGCVPVRVTFLGCTTSTSVPVDTIVITYPCKGEARRLGCDGSPCSGSGTRTYTITTTCRYSVECEDPESNYIDTDTTTTPVGPITFDVAGVTEMRNGVCGCAYFSGYAWGWTTLPPCSGTPITRPRFPGVP